MSINKNTSTVRLSSGIFPLIPSDSWEACNSHSDSEKVSFHDGEKDRSKHAQTPKWILSQAFQRLFSIKRFMKNFWALFEICTAETWATIINSEISKFIITITYQLKLWRTPIVCVCVQIPEQVHSFLRKFGRTLKNVQISYLYKEQVSWLLAVHTSTDDFKTLYVNDFSQFFIIAILLVIKSLTHFSHLLMMTRIL